MMWLFNRMKTNIKDMQATFKNISQSTVEQNIKTTGLFKKKERKRISTANLCMEKKNPVWNVFPLFCS